MRTITARTEIDRLFTEGRRTPRRTMLLIVLPTPEARDPNGRVLFVAGKRLGGAVTRNRAKRVMRAAVRRCGGPWRGLDVALVARDTTGTTPPAELDAVLREALGPADGVK